MGNVIITGGDLKNKGAQAMTFITVDEIKKRFPQENIYLACGDGTEADKRKAAPFCFDILDASVCDLKGLACINPFLRFVLKIRYGKDVYCKEHEKIWKETDLLIDISGYSIGTDWGIRTSILAALRGRIASCFGAKVYYMPQSFGPCNYKGFSGIVTNFLLKRWLTSAEVLFAREREGFKILTEQYGLKNVRLSCDMVLQNRGIELKHVFKDIPKLQTIDVVPHSIALIPNAKTFKYSREEHMVKVYRSIITNMMEAEYHIYLVYHSTEDQKICEKIKAQFVSSDQVIMIREELNCIEYGQLVRKFDFVIASRYHSVIHAFKEGIPCVVLGWAVKYNELLALFNQERFVFDVRKEVDEKRLFDVLDDMREHFSDYSVAIVEKLKVIQNENVFDVVRF